MPFVINDTIIISIKSISADTAPAHATVISIFMSSSVSTPRLTK